MDVQSRPYCRSNNMISSVLTLTRMEDPEGVLVVVLCAGLESLFQLRGPVLTCELVSDQVNHAIDSWNAVAAGLIWETQSGSDEEHNRCVSGVRSVTKSIY